VRLQWLHSSRTMLRGMAAYARVAALSELPDGGLLAVDVGADEVLLARLGDMVYAVGNICSHEHVWLDEGTLHRDSCEIECPMHEGRFDLRTGAATHWPCEEPVRSYEVRLEGEQILVAVRDD
jgi:nitrite reductase/ring-hydroxylating ferredoxin subunit